LPKIKIKDTEHNLSESAATALLAERTDFNRKIKKLKDSANAKDEELKTLKDTLVKEKKKLKKLKRETLLADVLSKIEEADDNFKAKSKDPYKVMKQYAKTDSKDRAVIQANFDVKIKNDIENANKKQIKNKSKKSDSLKISKKYYGGK